MKKNKILNGDEIDLINLFKFIWINKLSVILIFLLSFATTFTYKFYSNSKYKISIILNKGDAKLLEKYIYFDTIIISSEISDSDTIYNTLYKNFENIFKSEKDILLFLKNDDLNKDEIDIKFLKKSNTKYKLFLYHINPIEGSKILKSFVNYAVIKSQNNTIKDLRIIVKELKEMNIHNPKNFDLNRELFNYINLFEKDDISELFSLSSSKIVVSNSITVGLFLFISLIIGIVAVIIYLIVINHLESQRNYKRMRQK